MDSLAKLFDAYNREARVYPATLMLLPAVLLVLVAYPKSLVEEFPKNALGLLALFAVIYLFSGIARTAGKGVERKLLERWSGWPTTKMLRRSDATIDSVTKARYHRALSEMCPEIEWPEPTDEAADVIEADLKYGSALAVLRERRRAEEYALLHKENASYGFRRNMLGLRPYAILMVVLAALGACALLAAQVLHATSASTRLVTVSGDPRYILLLITDLGIGIAWIACVRPSWVHHAACDYAHALLRSLDIAT